MPYEECAQCEAPKEMEEPVYNVEVTAPDFALSCRLKGFWMAQRAVTQALDLLVSQPYVNISLRKR